VKLLRNLDQAIRRLETLVVGVGLLLATAIIFTNVVTRYFLFFSFAWAEEVTLYIMIWITFIGADLCVRQGSHVNMDFLLSHLPAEVRRGFLIGIAGGASAFCFVLMVYGADMTLRIAASGQTSSTLPLPFYLVYLAIPIGCTLMGVHFAQLAYLLARGERTTLAIDEEKT
jgi:C4-dicarboxylate transporter DctQ subunit